MKELEYPFDSGELLERKRSLKRELLAAPGLLDKNIAVLSGATVGELKNMLELFLLNQGIRPRFYEGQYDRYYEEIMFDNSSLREFKPDYIYIHTTVKNLRGFPPQGTSKEELEPLLEEEFARWSGMWDKLLEDFGCPVIQNNFEPLPVRLYGNSDGCRPDGALNYVNRINQRVYGYAAGQTRFFINDLSYQAACYGLDRWFDDTIYYLYKYPFAVDAIPLVAYNIGNIIKSLAGKNKKALVLDLDQTLWGGVIGEDGIAGIELGAETPKGMAYQAFQEYIGALGRIGVALNVCSKNDEETARLGFTHEASRLKAEDFIVFKANWVNKDLNIKEIAAKLNVGEDSLVFFDDNPAERELVRRSLEGVSVPELSAPEGYLRILDRSGYFETTLLSADDRQRASYYLQNKARKAATEHFREYSDYLRSLQMHCRMEAVSQANLERVTQLVNKTNQFNLTTRRYTLAELEKTTKNVDNIHFCGNLVDKFGGNGLVSVIIAGICGEEARIDLWIMSCRVFKRDLELAMFDELVRRCLERGVRRLLGQYIKTSKNGLVAEFYQSLGFTCLTRTEDQSLWEYRIPEQYQAKNHVMEIEI